MAKRRKSEEREVTRKETVRRRRDQEQNRRVLLALIAVGAVLVVLLAAGVIQELVIKPSQPVATVGDQRVTLSDFRKQVLFSWYQSGNQVTDPQGTSLQILDQLINDVLLREQAKQRGITVSADEVTTAIEESFGYQRTPPTPTPTPSVQPTPLPTPTPGGEPTATPYPTATPITETAFQTAYQNYLNTVKQATGMSEADFRSLVESDLLRSKLFDIIGKDVPTTEEQVHARHILVTIRTAEPTPTPLPAGQPAPTSEPGASPTPTPLPARDEAQALARVIEAQQKVAGGADFAQVAQEYSDDSSSAVSGGDLGWFGRGMMVTEFEDVAFSLEINKLSDPVKTTYGYHLIQVLEKDPAREMDAYTLQQKQYEAYQKWLTDLQAAAKITRNWSLDKVPPTPVGPGN